MNPKVVLRLRVEGIATGCFGDGHAQVDIKADSSDSDAWVVLIGRDEEFCTSMVMMAVTVAVTMRVASVAPCLHRVEVGS